MKKDLQQNEVKTFCDEGKMERIETIENYKIILITCKNFLKRENYLCMSKINLICSS